MKGMFSFYEKREVIWYSPPQDFQSVQQTCFYLRKLCYQMEICQKSLLGDWTHVMEAMLLIARLTETFRSKSYGRFSAVISGKIGALQGESHVILGDLVG